MRVDDRRRLGKSDTQLTTMGLSGAPLGNILVPVA